VSEGASQYQGVSQGGTGSATASAGDTGGSTTGRLLDGFLILATGGFTLPDDVVRVQLTSLDIVEVSDDLRFFTNLDSLDLGDNRLNYREVLEHVLVAPRLTKLSLACNQLAALACHRSVVHPAGSFATLEALDLGYNELHGDVLINLAALPRLKKLNLTANCVSSMFP